jgi:hypothetical protein
MTKLYKRNVRVTVGGKLYQNLRIAFQVTSSIRPEPNTAELTIYNLNEDSRTEVQKPKVPCIIEAGYGTELAQIFKGYLRDATNQNRGTDWVTTLITGDGDIACKESRISESFAKGAEIDKVIETLFKRLGPTVDVQNAIENIKKGKFREGLTQFTRGTTLYGKTVEQLTKMMKSKDLEWFIDQGQVQVIPRDTILPTSSGKVQRLTQNTGLIGSPQVGESKNIKIVSLLQPTFRLGTLLVLDSDSAKGNFRIEKLTHVGDTHDQPWYTYIEAKAV